MRTVEYRTDTERRKALADAKALGESATHDDFGVGVDGANRLTFETAVLPPVDPKQQRLSELATKIRSNSETTREFREFVLLHHEA